MVRVISVYLRDSISTESEYLVAKASDAFLMLSILLSTGTPHFSADKRKWVKNTTPRSNHQNILEAPIDEAAKFCSYRTSLFL